MRATGGNSGIQDKGFVHTTDYFAGDGRLIDGVI
jgi:hypothetical protein